jgi:RsiW-degrading membrane proteinase PrsW (M82 family)
MTSAAASVSRAEAIAESGWGWRVRLVQPHNPAWWLYLWMVVNGAYLFYDSLNSFRVSQGSLALALTLQALYTLPFVWFINRRDRYERLPGTLALMGFLWGGLVATWMIAAPANTPILNLYGKLVSVHFATSWGPALTAPFTEEIAKLLGVIICVLLARQHVRSIYDGMLLGMFVGLGFQVFENVQYMANTAQANFNSSPVTDELQIFVARGLTGVAGHWLFTAICGAGVGYYLSATDRGKLRRLAGAAGFVLFAMLLHGLFDAVGALGVASMAIAALGLIIGAIVIWKYANRRARTWMSVLLGDEVADGTVTQEELAILAGPRRDRVKFVKGIKKSQGKQAAKKTEWLLEAETDLATAIAATDNPHSPDARAARAEVDRVRALPAT